MMYHHLDGHDITDYAQSSEEVAQTEVSEHEYDSESHVGKSPEDDAVHAGPDSASTITEVLSNTPEARSSRRHVRGTPHFPYMKHWLLELGCWIASFIAFAAIVGVLAYFDGRTYSELKYGININTLVSVLATLGTALMTVPLNNGLGQLKWLRFRTPRELSDFQLLDGASRGAWGSLQLLFSPSLGATSSIGAVLTVGALAIHPFVQQIIGSEDRQVIRGRASLPISTCHYYDGVDDSKLGFVGEATKAAIYAGMYTLNRSFDVPMDCATGNCTWTPYYTLEICRTCADLSTEIKNISRKCDSGNSCSESTHILPNGWGLAADDLGGVNVFNLTTLSSPQPDNGTFVSYLSNETLPAWRSIAFQDRGVVLANIFGVRHGGNSNGTCVIGEGTCSPVAFECVLQYCVKKYSARAINGVLTETLLEDPWSNNTEAARTSVANMDPSGTVNEVAYYLQPPGQDMVFAATGLEVFMLSLYLSSFFNGSTWAGGLFDNVQSTTDSTQAVFNSADSLESIDSFMSNLTRSMSIGVRTQTSSPGSLESYYSQACPHIDLTATGMATSLQTVLSIAWPWISLPFALLVTTLIFSLVVMWQTQHRRAETWKNSGLAMVFHGLEYEQTRDVNSLDDLDGMDKAAKTIFVSLERGHTGWKLKKTGQSYGLRSH